MRLGLVIRKLKQLWPAGCVTAALLHGSPGLAAGDGGVPPSPEAAAAAAAAAEPADGGPDAEGTQRR